MSEQIQQTISILKDFLDEVDNLSYKVEQSKEYHGIAKDSELGKLFFYAYLKCRRSFIAVDELLKSEITSKFKHAYIEAFPFLRIMAECYIHFCYITDETIDKQTMIKDYDDIKNHQLKKILRISKIDYGNNKKDREQGISYIRRFKRRKFNKPFFFNNMHELAEKTGNSRLYEVIFTKYNPYIHFNPINFTVYGTFRDGKFIFNELDNTSRRLEGELLFYCIEIMMLLISRTCFFLKTPVFEELVTTFEKWSIMRDEVQTILFQNINKK
ncbi:hypothetical protein BCJMU51_5479 [Bacillus cereus]|uniref:DUF5677 domain-containing protein n=1 Tax=Bacillus cereus TaxID=1396 RepID=UPI001F17D621|nr:DUF5677 domain-containing protein [Bacillus cereus]BCB40560.1 hypothetical protein BCM0045_5455 [Bacillus cereus]BCC03396.1 hypothetical protein BCM0057_5478 [Bacillus cereus]BCC26915.1 hypothetical protein BCM0079_5508 [Bacillus cereus]BCC38475.1 hypothetical protein BCM0105_5465 [Bacillus cereus]BCC44273.1 hypothetical protein BCJMU01_5440 [Bacillus cereus]